MRVWGLVMFGGKLYVREIQVCGIVTGLPEDWRPSRQGVRERRLEVFRDVARLTASQRVRFPLGFVHRDSSVRCVAWAGCAFAASLSKEDDVGEKWK